MFRAPTTWNQLLDLTSANRSPQEPKVAHRLEQKDTDSRYELKRTEASAQIVLHMFPQASTAKIQPSTTMHWVAFLANAAEGFEASWPSPRNLITLQVEYVECALMVEPQTTPLFFLAGCSWWWFGGPLYWKPTDTIRYLQNWLKAMNSAANRNCPCFHSRGEPRAQALSRARKFAKVVLNAHFTFIWPKWSFNGDNDNNYDIYIYIIIIHWTRRYPLSDKLIFRQSAMKYSQISVTNIKLFCSCPQANPTWSPLTDVVTRDHAAGISEPWVIGTQVPYCLRWFPTCGFWKMLELSSKSRFISFWILWPPLFEYVWVLLWSLLLELPKTYKRLHRSFPRWRQVVACSVTSFVAIVRTSLHLGFVWK